MKPLVAVFVGCVVAWASLPWVLLRWTAAFAGFFLLFSATWSWLVRRGLTSGAGTPIVRTFSGRRLAVATKVENRSPLPTGVLFLNDSAGGLECWGETRRFLSLPPFSRFRAEFTVRGRERGERILGPLQISGSDPAGLFPFVRTQPARSLIVYPPLRTVRGWPPLGHPSGSRRWDSALADDPSRFRSFRDFRPGDPLARISAAAWARKGTPQVRTFEFTVTRPTGVVVDLRAEAYPLRLRWALLEAAVETAATLVWELLGRGEAVWLTVLDAGTGTPDRPALIGPGRGWAEARPFLERLALAVPDKTALSPTLPEALILPRPPLRLLWVAAAGQGPGTVRGFDLVLFPIEEGGPHGLVVHP